MLLITPQEVITIAFSNSESIKQENIRASKIDIAQEKFLRPRLGDQIYDSLCSDEYPDFNEYYIKPSLAYFTRYGVVEELSVELGSRGSVVFSGGNDTRNSNNNSNQVKAEVKTVISSITSQGTEIDTRSEDSFETVESAFSGTTNRDVTVTGTDDNTSVRVENSSTPSFVEDTTVETLYSTTMDDEFIMDNSDEASATTENITSNSNATTTNSETKEDDASVSIDTYDESYTTNSSSNETFRSAPITLIHHMQIRALSDANILLSKALRYVENNPDIFGLFCPSSRFYF